MHVLTLLLRGNPALELRYRSKEAALLARQRVNAATFADDLEMQDDHGRLVQLNRGMIEGSIIGDIAQDIKAKIEVAVMDMKAQQEAAAKMPRSGLVPANMGGIRQ